MTQPLALVLYERLIPGSQLVNRLRDLNYRVLTIAEAEKLVESATAAKPLLVLTDVVSTGNDVCAAIGRLKQNPATRHLPVIAFGGDKSPELQAAARDAGADLIIGETGLLSHLPQFLDQALQVE